MVAVNLPDMSIYIICQYTGWPTKMSLFFFGNNFYKNKESFIIFSLQILEVYRILLVETTLELIMFYYTFSVINTMFVPCTALLYNSTTATRTLKCPQLYWAFLVEIVWFLFWCCPLLSEDCFHKLGLSGTSSENSQVGWDFGNRMASGCRFDVKWVCPIGSYTWGIQVFCSRKEAPPEHFLKPEHLNTSGITFHMTDSFCVKLTTLAHPIPKISTHLTIFWGGTWRTEFGTTIHRQERN